MKWIETQHGAFLNLDHVESIQIEDMGREYTKNFRIYAYTQRREFILEAFDSKEAAENFLIDFYHEHLYD